MSPGEMLQYLRARGCKIGGVTMGPRGLVWYDETRTERVLRRCTFQSSLSSTRTAPATFSTAHISFRI